MRIRKHAKISPLIYAASSLKPGTLLQTHVCQLNQSPWDVMSFSPPSTPPPPLPLPSFQVSGNDDFNGNGSLGETIAAFQSTESMKMSMDEGETEAMKLEYSGSGTDSGSAMDMVEVEVSGEKDKEVVLCGKTDGKAWKCKRKASQGNSLCDHHLSLRSYNNNVAQLTAKKADKGVVDSRRRPRTKKAAAASTLSASNPYEFYYYSGFGPRWGKKRGETSQISNSRDVCKDVDKKREMGQSSSLSQIESEESEMKDEIEYEEEDEDNSESESQRKRARKPIKARSLKSLM